MKNDLPALKSKIVQAVLMGKSNEMILKEIPQTNLDKNFLNREINKERKWFNMNPRCREYAIRIMKMHGTDDAQFYFEKFCLMAKPFQKQILKRKNLIKGEQ